MSKALTDLENFIIENYGEVGCDDLERPPRPPVADTPPEEENYSRRNFVEGNNRNENDENLGKVFINETQYFENIPEAVWNLYIGNSQPAQKWLIDRKGKLLESNDIKQYQKTIATLIAINTIVKEINKIEIQ